MLEIWLTKTQEFANGLFRVSRIRWGWIICGVLEERKRQWRGGGWRWRGRRGGGQCLQDILSRGLSDVRAPNSYLFVVGRRLSLGHICALCITSARLDLADLHKTYPGLGSDRLALLAGATTSGDDRGNIRIRILILVIFKHNLIIQVIRTTSLRCVLRLHIESTKANCADTDQ